jgi:hypothetical protein
MSALALSCIIFVLVLGDALLDALLRTMFAVRP